MRARKLAICCALVSILAGYMEWGRGRSAFVYEVEDLVLSQGGGASALAHPAVFVPLAGQLLLLVALIQAAPDRRLVLAGLSLLGVLALLLLLAGLASRNPRIVSSTLPFFAAAAWCVRRFQRKHSAARAS